ncbi:hypothetical protein EV363DRAFT_1171322, partial [Boletus edulis]
RHKSPGSHDSFSCHNAIPPRGCGLGVCKSDVASQRPVITAQLMLRRDFASRIPECSRPPALAGVSRVHCN